MKKNDTQTTMKIPIKLIDYVKEYYDTSKLSEAIRKGLKEYILLPVEVQNIDSFEIHQLLDIKDRVDVRCVSIRIPAEFKEFILNMTEEDFQVTVSMILAKMIINPLDKADFRNSCLLHVLGSKWNVRMQKAIKYIQETSGKTWAISVETCAGALGIHMNATFANKEIINDDDMEKINLYRVIQEYPTELKIKCLLMEPTKDYFDVIKKEKVHLITPIDINAAARFLFLNILSYRNTGNTFDNAMTVTKYRRALDSIYPFHQHLKDTKICENDIFKIIGKYKKSDNTLFIVDPTYLDANVYKNRSIRSEATHGKEFGLKEHKKLAKMLYQENKQGNDFIYFCRTTAKREKYKENGCLKLSTDKLIQNDRHMKGMIDDLYYGHGFYYMDVPLDGETIERIITSFNFEGANLYREGELQ